MAGTTRKTADKAEGSTDTTRGEAALREDEAKRAKATDGTETMNPDVGTEARSDDGDDVPKGVDGVNPVTPNNPAPKAVIQ
jgi:hypothetical protein